MLKMICEQCGKEFGKYPYQLKNRKHHFCSVPCSRRFRKSSVSLKERKGISDRAYYLKNKKKLIAYAKKHHPQWAKNNPEKIKAIMKRHRVKLRSMTLRAYGGKCACCGLADEPFLSIDHINNDGAEHRKKEKLGGAGYHVYAWLKKHGYPKGFQVLCYNCNMAKQHFGVCPHQSRPSS